MTTPRKVPSLQGIPLAFRHTPGSGPAVVFLPGYMSDMAGSKACAVFDHCAAVGRECLLLDYSGCGMSDGDFADGTLSIWRDEVLLLIDNQLDHRKVILVGSSMGGWLMLLVGLALGDRLAGMVGIAAAPDFSEWGYSPEQKALLATGVTILEDNPYGPEPTPTHAHFWNDAQGHRLLSSQIPLTCPIRLLHGQDDADVPPEISHRLAAALASEDVEITLIKGGDHRLSREKDILRLIVSLESIL